MTRTESKTILICGYRAYAARGLRLLLEAKGHRVAEFSRGPLAGTRDSFTGPVTELHENLHLAEGYDAVVNFIVLKHESLQRNLDYCHSLWRTCCDRNVRHLIHVSSMSVYRDSVRVITEDTATKTNPCRCGAYTASKVVAERFLRERSGPNLKLSLLRPAWIVGDDMFDPVGSAATRLKSGNLLVLAKPCRQRPVIGRSVLHRALANLVVSPPRDNCETLLLVDRNSPTYLEYLQGCCDILGNGTRAISCSAPIWMGMLLLRELRKRNGLSGRAVVRTLSSILQRSTRQRFDPTWTESRLAMPLTTQWKEELVPRDFS